jgi:hypothetical protein
MWRRYFGLQATSVQLETLDRGLAKNPSVSVQPNGRIVVSPLVALPEPVHLVGLKGELVQRWAMTSLIDILKETDLRVGITPQFASPRRTAAPDLPALAELGKAVKTIFLCRYLHLEALRRHDGLNVVENWNSANGFILLRQGRRDQYEPSRRTGVSGALAAPAAKQPGLHQHAHAPARAGGAGVNGQHDDGRSARSDAVDLHPYKPVWNVFAEPG